MSEDGPDHDEAKKRAPVGKIMLAGLASLIVPGTGQLIASKTMRAFEFFVGTIILWFVSLGFGWIAHIVASIDAMFAVRDRARREASLPKHAARKDLTSTDDG